MIEEGGVYPNGMLCQDKLEVPRSVVYRAEKVRVIKYIGFE